MRHAPAVKDIHKRAGWRCRCVLLLRGGELGASVVCWGPARGGASCASLLSAVGHEPCMS